MNVKQRVKNNRFEWILIFILLLWCLFYAFEYRFMIVAEAQRYIDNYCYRNTSLLSNNSLSRFSNVNTGRIFD